MKRKAVYAGSFYPYLKEKLYSMVDTFLEGGCIEEREVPGIMVPHAGYLYSGKVAGMTFSSVCIPDTVVVIGPNHRGIGDKVAVMKRGVWEIPGGGVEIDEELAELMISSGSLLSDDSIAHRSEHSIEVQLPFIKRKNPDVRIVPISLSGSDPVLCSELADILAEAIKKHRVNVLLVASSDMSHFISVEEASSLDFEAIEKMKNMDSRGLMDIVRAKKISMCGVLPAAVVIGASKKLKAKKGELVAYNTSAEATGNRAEVVAYAGMRFL